MRRVGWLQGGVNVTAAPADADQKIRQFVEGLLVVLKHELYEGNWDEMVVDLEARLEGRPYIFKLAHRIVDDLERIRRLRRFEQHHGVDLGGLIEFEV